MFITNTALKVDSVDKTYFPYILFPIVHSAMGLTL